MPAKRTGPAYVSAADLADDLERYLAGRPIVARPVSAGQRAWKWARRQPTLAAALSGMVLAVVLGFAGVTWALLREHDRAAEAERQTKFANKLHEESERDRRAAEVRASHEFLERGLSYCSLGDVPRGLNYLAQALALAERLEQQTSTEETDTLEALRRCQWICRSNLARWPARLALRPRFQVSHDAWVFDSRFDAAGRFIVSGDRAGLIRLGDVASNRQIGEPITEVGSVNGVRVLPGGDQFLAAVVDEQKSHAMLHRWDIASRTRVGPELPFWPVGNKNIGSFINVAVVPGGAAVMTQTGTRTLKFLSLETGAEVRPTIVAATDFPTVVLSADGNTVFTGHVDGFVRKWDAQARLVGEWRRHTGAVTALALSPNETLVLSGSYDGSARLAKATGEALGAKVNYDAPVKTTAFSRDGRLGVVGGGKVTVRHVPSGFAQVWDTATATPAGAIFEHPHVVWCAAFARDRLLFTGAEDGQLRAWSPDSGRQVGQRRCSGTVARLDVSPDECLVVASDIGGTPGAVLVEAGPSPLVTAPLRHPAPVNSMAFSPDGRTLLTLADDACLRSFELEHLTAKPRKLPVRGDARLRVGARRYQVSHLDRRRGTGHSRELWDARAGTALKAVDLPNSYWKISFHPNSRT